MRYKKFFDGTKIPVLGLGACNIGVPEDLWTPKEIENMELLQSAIRMGYTHIDTAEGYSDGYSEILIWKAIQKFPREKVFITTKVRKDHLWYNQVICALIRSLKRLKTDYIDLYLIHGYSSEIDISETIEALTFLKKIGKIRNFWVSNFSKAQLIKAMKYTDEIAVNQIKLNYLQCNHQTKELLKFCIQSKILVMGYRPLLFWRYPKRHDILSQTWKKYNKSVAQILLKWVIQQKWVVSIVKSTQKEHLRQNLDIFDFTLPSWDLK